MNQICLASNCFSIFDESYCRRLNWKCCESILLPVGNPDVNLLFANSQQLSAVSLECLQCKHNICSTCMEEYKILPIPVCPAEDCSGKASEVDESNLCDGICKKYVEEGKYITTSCCQAKIDYR
uniref:Bm10876 n=1 Tax=Brugia malayi TaxID=6279 RepID=A0A1I9G4H4_BRUMA|nr:Bm10876 [Brugia malayi]